LDEELSLLKLPLGDYLGCGLLQPVGSRLPVGLCDPQCILWWLCAGPCSGTEQENA